MKSNKLAAITLSTLVGLTSACATSYKRVGLMGGYSDTQLSPDIFQVHFDGNGYTSKERAKDFALLRAAEISLEKGFPYFVIVDRESGTAINAFALQNSLFFVRKPEIEIMVQGFLEKPTSTIAFDAAFLQKSLFAKYDR